MDTKRILRLFIGVIFLTMPSLARCETTPDQYPFEGTVTADDIKVRADATVNSQVICSVAKGERVTVLSESYGWDKIHLPKNALAYIKKEFVAAEGAGTIARVINDSVNIRLGPDISSRILGRVKKDELIKIKSETGDWFRIEPPPNAYGWIHNKFVKKGVAAPVHAFVSEAKKTEQSQARQTAAVTISGLLKPKIITSIATHKLISADHKTYLINSKEDLSGFNNERVRITGIPNLSAKKTVIDVEKIEALN